jgi:steroid delta-isomerase-like uncharacterized protein
VTRRTIILLGLGLCAGAGFGVTTVATSQSTQSTGQTSLEANKALVRRWIDQGFNKRELTVIDAVFAESFTVNEKAIGRSGLKQSMAARLAAFPDLRVAIVVIVAERDQVAIWYTARGTQRGEFDGVKPTGRQVRWVGSDFLRIERGQIVEGRFVDDSLGLLRQLGVTSR